MRTRIKLVMFGLLLSCLLIGCNNKKITSIEDNRSDTSMFITIEQTINYRVVYQKDTKVMYIVSLGGYNAGNFTLLVNPDGSPMVYKEDVK